MNHTVCRLPTLLFYVLCCCMQKRVYRKRESLWSVQNLFYFKDFLDFLPSNKLDINFGSQFWFCMWVGGEECKWLTGKWDNGFKFWIRKEEIKLHYWHTTILCEGRKFLPVFRWLTFSICVCVVVVSSEENGILHKAHTKPLIQCLHFDIKVWVKPFSSPYKFKVLSSVLL